MPKHVYLILLKSYYMKLSNNACSSYKLVSWIQSWKELVFCVIELCMATKNWAMGFLYIIKKNKIPWPRKVHTVGSSDKNHLLEEVIIHVFSPYSVIRGKDSYLK